MFLSVACHDEKMLRWFDRYNPFLDEEEQHRHDPEPVVVAAKPPLAPRNTFAVGWHAPSVPNPLHQYQPVGAESDGKK
jgi:hypothetical protein